jgi:DNA primase
MIPESFINELLNRVDVVDIIDKRVPLKKAGANFVACCPFHQEKTPSFSVSHLNSFIIVLVVVHMALLLVF